MNEMVAAKRVGGYMCTTSDVKHAFRAGWQAALECTCNNADPSKDANCKSAIGESWSMPMPEVIESYAPWLEISINATTILV